MKNNEIIVLPRSVAKEFVCDKPWAAISISTNFGEWPNLSEENRVGLLQVDFWDLTSVCKKMPDGGMFDEARARQILDFVFPLWEDIDVLLVHCEAGVSRSPAVAAALSVIAFGPRSDLDYFRKFVPNTHVYRVLLKTYYEGIEPEIPEQQCVGDGQDWFVSSPDKW
jgi:predicted protein tyrosine phosphatase